MRRQRKGQSPRPQESVKAGRRMKTSELDNTEEARRAAVEMEI